MHTPDLLNSENLQGQIDQHKNFGERPGLQAVETLLMSECNISLLQYLVISSKTPATMSKFLQVRSFQSNYTNIACLRFFSEK